MSKVETKGSLRAFLDFFILFSGISTASNLARTQGRPLLTKGIFLIRNFGRGDSDVATRP